MSYEIEIFRTGTHTDSSGRTRDWTVNDLETIVRRYNEQSADETHTAPIVIGHPSENGPAWGWVDSLQLAGNRITAKLRDVADQFVEWVKAGHYRKVSPAFYPDLRLRHVGFLGAQPPAVKGLAEVAFSEPADTVLEFEESDQQSFTNTPKPNVEEQIAQIQAELASLRQAVGQLIAALSGQQQGQQNANAQQAPPQQPGNFSEQQPDEVTRLQQQLADAQSRLQLAEFREWANSDEVRLRVPATEIPAVIDQLRLMASVGTFEFSDGEASALERFKAGVLARPKLTEFGEMKTKGPDRAAGTTDHRSLGEEIAKAN